MYKSKQMIFIGFAKNARVALETVKCLKIINEISQEFARDASALMNFGSLRQIRVSLKTPEKK